MGGARWGGARDGRSERWEERVEKGNEWRDALFYPCTFHAPFTRYTFPDAILFFPPSLHLLAPIPPFSFSQTDRLGADSERKHGQHQLNGVLWRGLTGGGAQWGAQWVARVCAIPGQRGFMSGRERRGGVEKRWRGAVRRTRMEGEERRGVGGRGRI